MSKINKQVDDILLAKARSTPLLAPAEEIELSRAIRAWQLDATGNEDLAHLGRAARSKMIASNILLVYSVASRKQATYAEYHQYKDLVQAGFFGLNRAAELFDPSFGCRFSTYAVRWIDQSIDRYHTSHGRTVRLPVHVYLWRLKIHKAARQLKSEGKPVTDDAIAAVVGKKPEYVTRMKSFLRSQRSLDEPLPGCVDINLLDTIESVPLQLDLDKREQYERIRRSMERLSPEIGEVLFLNFFRDMSLKKIAAHRNVSYATCARARRQGLKILKEMIGDAQ